MQNTSDLHSLLRPANSGGWVPVPVKVYPVAPSLAPLREVSKLLLHGCLRQSGGDILRAVGNREVAQPCGIVGILGGEAFGDEKIHGLALLSPSFPRHDAVHEFVKQRHGESGISMARAPDHSFGNQLVPHRTERRHFAIQYLSNVP